MAHEKATFAGGCFWCMESEFKDLAGVEKTEVGYTGGHVENPTYEQVSSGKTGHFEAMEVTYDPGKISYEKLLDVFWGNIDPTDPDGQFCDKGSQYRTAIFTHSDAQKAAAEVSKATINKSGRFKVPVATLIVPASTFYPAEDYHQAYYLKNPMRYSLYRRGCGRDQRLQKLWGEEQK